MKEPQMNIHNGTSLDDFLKEEGLYEQASSLASKRVFAWQLNEAMKNNEISKSTMAKQMKTGRAQIDRLLNPDDGNVTLLSLHKAAAVLGKSVRLELI
jgi:antitoxin HicB